MQLCLTSPVANISKVPRHVAVKISDGDEIYIGAHATRLIAKLRYERIALIREGDDI